MSKNAKILAVVAIVGVIGYLIYSNKPAAAPAAAAAPTPSATGVVAQAQAALAAIQTGYAQGKATVDAVQARTMLVQTVSEVTPSNVWRDRLTKLVERLQRGGTQIVWEPCGLWDAEDAPEIAKKLGIVLCVDPFQSGVPRGPIAYLRLRALGETRSFGAARVEALASELRDRREVYVVVEAPRALTTAQLLGELIRRNGGCSARRCCGRGRRGIAHGRLAK